MTAVGVCAPLEREKGRSGNERDTRFVAIRRMQGHSLRRLDGLTEPIRPEVHDRAFHRHDVDRQSVGSSETASRSVVGRVDNDSSLRKLLAQSLVCRS